MKGRSVSAACAIFLPAWYHPVAARRSVAPGQTFVLPPLLSRGPSRLESVGSSPECLWGGTQAEDEFCAF